MTASSSTEKNSSGSVATGVNRRKKSWLYLGIPANVEAISAAVKKILIKGTVRKMGRGQQSVRILGRARKTMLGGKVEACWVFFSFMRDDYISAGQRPHVAKRYLREVRRVNVPA